MSSPLSLFNELTTPSLSSPDGVSSTSFRHESILEIMYLSDKFQLQISCIHTYLGSRDRYSAMVFFLRLSCLQHGDSWHNNFVFRKARDVVKVAIVDWQVSDAFPLVTRLIKKNVT